MAKDGKRGQKRKREDSRDEEERKRVARNVSIFLVFFCCVSFEVIFLVNSFYFIILVHRKPEILQK